MKKYGWVILAAILIWLWPSSPHVNAAGAELFLDGKRVEAPAGAKPEMVNGKIMVPLRVVGEQLGYQFKWEPQAYKISIQKNSTDMSMYVGRTSADVNGKTVSLDAPPVLRGSSTMVPLRFVGEQMGLKVDWNNQNKSVNLSQKIATQPADKQSQSQQPSQTSTQSTKSTNKTSTATATTITPVEADKHTEAVPSTSKEQNVEQTTTNAVLVQNISFENETLKISLNKDLTPKVSKMTGPDRIVVDLPETSLSTDLLQSFPVRKDGTRALVNSYSEDVQEIRFAPADGTKGGARIVIALNKARDYDLSTNGIGDITLQLRERSVNPEIVAPTNVEGRRIVVIDPGHGGKDPGAGSVTGRHEKEFTLAVALKVQQLAQNDPDIQIVLTRNGDTYPTLDERPQLANNQQASVFVSIHGNSMPTSNNGKANGSETYYARQESLSLATIMHKHLVAATEFKDNGIKVANHVVTRKSQMPAVLLECGYLSNLSNEAAMFTEETQQMIAEGIVDGLKEYLGTGTGVTESLN
ncbi:N-acetylmuramoyl-L-alanine amidase family protein [Paenibacillus sp. AK121]|uniref:N-acetylmuramoyl-L-alanine amidase n=1 Tax=Paenibacillus TaxID=44249 RepID=UPI001C22D0E3|nr:N-acetylmuramoyl-L-alanine amidase [Paenibacillus sp. AK121]MBU9706656.1 N-acetylmuramoyl-L-alanine amidase family protein [Paenibacillus sp. AK121]MEE4566934.1 N-acetylmuramoyl-L-alanine amidase [Paenibacillus polymyxa]